MKAGDGMAGDLPCSSRAVLEQLLQECGQSPHRQAEIARRIDAAFGQDRAVLVMDMSGFSRATHEHGIVHSLVMVHRVQQIVRSCVADKHGQLVKSEADNLFCLFDAPLQAVRAATDIVRSVSAGNKDLPPGHGIHVSIGIGFGRILNVGNEDLYGHEVNLASKLGEDVGTRNEILLTAAARQALPPETARLLERTVEVSGMRMPYFVVMDATI